MPQVDILFVSYRSRAKFPSMAVRMIRGQQHNGKPLSGLDSNQRASYYEVIESSIVGIPVPRCLAGVLVVGHHLHFLSSDCKRGHGLGLSADDAMIEQQVPNFAKIRKKKGSGSFDVVFGGYPFNGPRSNSHMKVDPRLTKIDK
ncbi:hypothetical protein PAAG_03859 [Paracoccidioides lutzii Pb01]|uniref:Alpha-acetolactate decarboxylase n=1 Tax=Paracoccidioides lutzii (strain ATCC MYA-826 / Pb01) TaxID=502779 RepID=C1GZB5_PARBA|nr:hypothetical protein PAAG_03859 [Paracoccidioides lutzii Pb01]EEH41938.2 hypothetical protein PAAG_03859 [Paracoccidioides lutzii Pb01]